MPIDFSKLREIAQGLAPDSDLADFDAETASLAEVSAGADAKIEELTAQLADAEDRYQRTAAKNYELMLAATDEPRDEQGSEDEDEGADGYDVDSLFGEGN